MKITLYIFFLASSLSCFSQKEDFFENFEDVKLPIVLDDLTFNDFEIYRKINYRDIDISKYLKSPDGSFSIILQDESIQLFAIGKYKYDGFTFLIVGSKDITNNYNCCVILVYDNNKNLHSYQDVAFQDFNRNRFKRCLLSNSYIIEYTTGEGKSKEENILIYSKSTKRFPFLLSEDLSLNKNNLLDSLPYRPKVNYIFNKDFFKKNLNLLPLKYVSPYTNTQILTSIGGNERRAYKNFFIHSEELIDKEKIIFFLNVYEFDAFLQVKQVGYILFNSNGEVKKIDEVALYLETINNEESIFPADVKVENDSLIIERRDIEKSNQTFKLNWPR